MSLLGWSNILLWQWFFVRRTRGKQWLVGVVPLTGWWSNYIWVVPKKWRIWG